MFFKTLKLSFKNEYEFKKQTKISIRTAHKVAQTERVENNHIEICYTFSHDSWFLYVTISI